MGCDNQKEYYNELAKKAAAKEPVTRAEMLEIIRYLSLDDKLMKKWQKRWGL